MNYPDATTVPHNWNVGDVILDLYEVMPVSQGFGATSAERSYHEGGFGRVYKVWHRGWNREMAVKVAREEAFTTQAQKDVFTRECETWVDLGLHMHIAACHYVRNLGGVPRVFSEYAPAGTLQDWIGSRRLYEGTDQEVLARILDVSIQFAWGLHYAHERGFIHKDVKPLNALMWDDTTLKVSDFGLAGARSKAGIPTVVDLNQSVLVSSGAMTPPYCSPEQAAGVKLDRGTDVWSWAVSVLQMFEGEITWRSGSAAGHALRFYQDNVGRKEGIPAMPAAVAQLMQQCFAPNKGDRRHSLSDCAEALCKIFKIECGETYPRDEPSLVQQSAGFLNNKALSLLDLGQTAEALEIWNEACRLDSSLVDPFYNLSLHRIRSPKDRRHLPAIRKRIDTRFPEFEVTEGSLLARAHLLAELGEYQAAQKCLSLESTGRKPSTATEKLLRQFAENTVSSKSALGHFSIDTGRQEIWVNQDWNRVLKCVRSDGSGHELELMQMDTKEVLRRIPYPGLSSKAVPTRDLNYVTTLVRNGSLNSASLMTLWDISSERELASFECYPANIRPAITDDARTIFFCEEKAIRRARRESEGFVVSDFSNVSYPMTIQLFENTDILMASGYNTHEPLRQSPETRLIALSSRQTIFSIPQKIGIAAICKNKKWLVGDCGGTIYVFDIESQTPAFVLAGHNGPIRAMFVSPDSSLLASASSDGTVRLWDLNRRACRTVFEVANNCVRLTPVIRVEISPDNTHLLTVTSVGEVCDWKIPTSPMSYHAPWRISRPISAHELTKYQDDFDSLMSAASDSFKRESYLECAQLVMRARSIPGHTRNRRAIEQWGSLYSKMSKRQLNGTWQLARRPGKNDCFLNVSDVFISDTFGYCCLSVTTDRRVLVHNVEDLQIIKCFPSMGNKIHVLKVLNDGKIGIVWEGRSDTNLPEATIAIVSVYSTDFVNTVRCHETFSCACFDARMENLLLGTDTGEVKVFDLAAGRVASRFVAHDYPVTSLSVSPCGEYLATSGGDYDSDIGLPARLWKMCNWECISEIGTQSRNVVSSRFSPDSSSLFVNQDKVWLWSLRDMSLLKEINCTGSIEWCDVDGHHFAAVSGGDTVLFNLDSEFPIRKFKSAHRFSPECRFAVSIEMFQGHSTLVSHFCDWGLISKMS